MDQDSKQWVVDHVFNPLNDAAFGQGVERPMGEDGTRHDYNPVSDGGGMLNPLNWAAATSPMQWANLF